jgi:hypothetical protein
MSREFLHPEYEFFTGVDVKLKFDADNSVLEFSKVSSKDENLLQSLIIREGATGSGQQLQQSSTSVTVANGSISLYDTGNYIYKALIAYRESGKDIFLNQVTITLKSYTGFKTYSGTVQKWTCSFDGGVPIIKLDWIQCGNCTSSEDISLYSNPKYNPDGVLRLYEEGVPDFSSFKEIFTSLFTPTYVLVTSKNEELSSINLEEISGKIYVFTGESYSSVDLTLNSNDVRTNSSKEESVYRFFRNMSKGDVLGIGENQILTKVMNEFCTAFAPNKIRLGWCVLENNKILIYGGDDFIRMKRPTDQNVVPILNQSVFIYNSSLTQGSLFKMSTGEDRVVFPITNISTSFDSSTLIATNYKNQANANQPNGNLIISSRGPVLIPSGVPTAIANSIRNISSLNVANSLAVTMTVYNFVHFFALGATEIRLIVYDHLGEVHPLTGKFIVKGYTYTLDEGCVKADVVLQPSYNLSSEDFASSLSDPSTNTTGNPPPSATEYYPDSNNSGAALSSYVSLSQVDYRIT